MLVKKQAFFSIRFAKNIRTKSAAARKAALDQLNPKARALVSTAIVALDNKEKSNNEL